MYNTNTPLVELPSAGTSKSSPDVFTLPDSPEKQPDLPLQGTSKSSPHFSKLPKLQGKQSELPLPGTSKSSSSGVFILPESLEEMQELGLTKGITEPSPFIEAQRSGNVDLEGLYLIITLLKI